MKSSNLGEIKIKKGKEMEKNEAHWKKNEFPVLVVAQFNWNEDLQKLHICPWKIKRA